jgi:hypothetical protein
MNGRLSARTTSSCQQASSEVPDDPKTISPLAGVVIASASLLALLPMLHFGIPSGHDLEFHLNSWMEVVNQWHSGVVHPHWAVGAHYGFGEARFVFYPPASWMLGALLGAVLPWAIVPAAYMWIALTAAGFSMYFLARRFLPIRDSVFAAVFYAINPYHLVIVYWRSAYAELLASFLMPLLWLFVLRTEEDGKRSIVPLALVVAAAWLTNAPAGVMVNYSLALIVAIVAFIKGSPRILLYGACAVALGAVLAGFYLLPVAFEQKWVNIGEVFSSGVRPQDNFLFTELPDADHNRFNLLVSMVAVVEIGLVSGLAFLARVWKKSQPDTWFTAVLWAAASALLMLSPTFVFWQYLPKLRFVQLPWRWLLCLNVPLALLIVIAFRRWRTRVSLGAVFIAVLVLVCVRIQPPWWDGTDDLTEMHDNIVEGKGYEGTDEYVPAGIDPYEIKQDTPNVVDPGNRQRVRIIEWHPEARVFVSEGNQPTKLHVRLFHYPRWSVQINGVSVQEESDEITGQIVIPVQAGKNRVRIAFAKSWDEMAGLVMSLSGLAVVAILSIFFRRQEAQE